MFNAESQHFTNGAFSNYYLLANTTNIICRVLLGGATATKKVHAPSHS